ncbi:unnamed protein product [Amaranthus hypochondriacus]
MPTCNMESSPEATASAAKCHIDAARQTVLCSNSSPLEGLHQAADDTKSLQAAGPIKGGLEGEQHLDDEEGWTPVPPGRTARRGCQKTPNSADGGTPSKCDHESNKEEIDLRVGNKQNRDGNPQIPFIQ